MAEERVQRRLAAILAADVVGYSRLMGDDEAGTRARFNAHLHELIEPAIARGRGRIVKTTGDGLLVEFGSVVDAVQCAVEIQDGMTERNADEPNDRRIEFRIGVNLGDVIIEGEDIHGDGVNVAARLEGLADPGSICISGSVFDSVRNKLPSGFEDLGEQKVKNIAEPVRAYRVLPEGQQAIAPLRKKAPSRWRTPAIAAILLILIAAGGVAWWQPWVIKVEAASVERMAYPLPDKPSIAVLPFTNMSGDKAQEYFSDGITEDIITDLAKISGLFVVDRNSTFTYKGKVVKAREVAENFGVRYVLEGSVRRSQDRVRINVQLIDAVKGSHVWAERYDRKVEDVFAVQNDVTGKVVSELAVTLKADEHDRFFRGHTKNLEAYETFLQARRIGGFAADPNRRAKRERLLEKVIELDPEFAGGYAYLADMIALSVRLGFSASPKKDIERAFKLAKKAVAVDETFSQSHLALGLAYLSKGEHDLAVAAGQEAVRLQPSFADAHALLGYFLHWAGRGEEGIAPLKTAMRLEPKPRKWVTRRNLWFFGFANFTAGRYQDATTAFNRNYEFAVRVGHNALSFVAAAYMATGEDAKARAAMKALLDKKPKYTLSNFPYAHLYKRAEDRDRFAALLRRAGMPEYPPLKLPDKPSIAVLPFTNMSGDKEQEYFSDGITEDIITDLSKVSGLFVIARNSSFKFKGRSVDVRHVARDLGVGYVVEGSVRKSDRRVRITAQLIDATTGNHLWAERYDRELSDIFGVQDDVVGRIVSALAVELTDADNVRRARQHRTVNLQAYEYVLRGRQLLRRIADQDTEKAREYFEKAISIDPAYARAYTNLGLLYWNAWRLWGRDRASNLTRALQIGRKAVALDPDDAGARTLLAVVHQFRKEHDLAEIEADKAIALGPTHAETLGNLGGYLRFAGRPRQAVEYLERAVRLDPFHPTVYLTWLGGAYATSGRHAQAIGVLKRAIRREPDYIVNHVALAAAYGNSGRDADARAQAAEILRLNPNFTLRAFRAFVPVRKKADLDRYVTGLRRAGLPE